MADKDYTDVNIDIDLGDYGYGATTIGGSGPGTSSISTISIGSGGAGTTGNSYSFIPDSSSWGGNSNITIPDGGDIKIGERSLVEFMNKIEERLAILVPDPAKLEKFQALKIAYENYKTLEALLKEDDI